jgi:hypothetical protein
MIPNQTSTRLSHGSRSGEVDLDPRLRGQPGAELDALVGGVVVHHQVQLALGIGPGHMLEEREELLVAVPVLAHPR